MKNSRKFLFGSLLLVAMTGCVGGVAVAGDDGGVYYGGGPWFHDDAWVDGGRGWYGGAHDVHGGGAYVHPAGAHASAGGSGGEHHR